MAVMFIITDRRTRPAWLLGAALLIVSILLSSVAWAGPVGKVNGLKGRATITRASSGQSAAAALEARLFLRDGVRTFRASVMSLLFIDKTIVTVSQNSRLKINTYMFDPFKRTRRSALHLISGAIKFTTSRLMGFKVKRLEVVTQTATVGVRGTTGVVEVLTRSAPPAGSVSVVYNTSRDGSQVEAKLNSNPARTRTLNPGQIVRVYADGFGPVTTATSAEQAYYGKMFSLASPASGGAPGGWSSVPDSGSCGGE